MSKMGKRINQKRKEMGLTMQELADKLGVQASAVNKWEKGTVENIKRSTIQQMSDLFGCAPVWLMGYDDSEEPSIPEYIEGTVEIIDLYSKVTPEQRQAVLNLLRSFVND